MYRERRKLAFDGVRHWAIVADPATHSKKDVLAALCYSWETGIAAHGDLQYLPETKLILPSEVDMPEHIAELLAANRLERVSAFRQLQALSNLIENVGVLSGFDDFFLDSSFHLRQVQANEVRMIVDGRAFLVDRESGRRVPVLPDAALATAQSNNLLVLSLDQGSVGAAGIAFAESIGMMIHAKWDKFHRLMRDINLTLSSVSGGVFLKSRIFQHTCGL